MKSFLPFLLLITILSWHSCKEPEPVPNNCDATILDTPVTSNIYIRMKVPNTTLAGTGIKVFDADNLDTKGTLTIISCLGVPGVSFNLNSAVDFTTMSDDSISQGFFLQEYNPFTFTNSGDYLLFSTKLTARFSDGKTFDSDDLSLLITYPELSYDTVKEITYLNAYVPNSIHWYQVGQ